MAFTGMFVRVCTRVFHPQTMSKVAIGGVTVKAITRSIQHYAK